MTTLTSPLGEPVRSFGLNLDCDYFFVYEVTRNDGLVQVGVVEHGHLVLPRP